MHDEAAAATLTSLLAWYREMGVDEAIGESPVDWTQHGVNAPGADVLAQLPRPQPAGEAAAIPRPAPAPSARDIAPPRAAPPRSPAAAAAPARSFSGIAPDASQMAARAAAAGAASIADLETALQSFDGCGLKATAKNLCLYRGAAQARVMFVGEAPGRDEDLEGKPFVGPAGQLLDRMLAAIGLTAETVHITNIVYWRPPGNRTPTPQEAIVCRPFLERQIGLVAPEFLIPLGGAAAKHLLDVAEGIMRVRGRWKTIELGGRSLRVLPTLHPAYLLRTPAAKRLAWRDLLTLKAAL
jgi:uracil-DNA glycosylase family 4